MVQKKKPTKKRQKELGQALQEKLSKNSTEIKTAGDAFSLQSENIKKTIDKAIETEDKNITNLLEKLESLNKDNKNYEQNKKKIQFEIKMSEAKIKAFHSLDDSLELLAKLTEKLLTDLANGVDTKDLVADQVAHLASVASQLEALGVDTKFDREDVLKQFADILEKKHMDKIEKRLKHLDDYLFDPAKKSGLFTTLTDFIGVSLLGPIGKPVVEALKLSEKIESKVEKSVLSILGLQKDIEETKSTYDIIKQKLDESELKDEEKEKILKSLAAKEERFEEQEADRTQDFRSASLALQKKGLDKGEENGLGIMQILGLLTGGKLIGGIAKGLLGALSAKGLLNILKGRLAAGVSTAAAGAAAGGTLSKIAPKAGSLLKGAVKRLGAAGALYGAWEGGQFIGKQINENFGEEINDAVWWALQEAPEEVKERFLKAKESMATTILDGATNTYEAHLSFHRQNFQHMVDFKNTLFNKLGFDTNNSNATSYTYNMIASEITRMREDNARKNLPFYQIPKVQKFPLPMMQQPKSETEKPKETKDKQQTLTPMSPGKISMDDIPMRTKDDALLLLATTQFN